MTRYRHIFLLALLAAAGTARAQHLTPGDAPVADGAGAPGPEIGSVDLTRMSVESYITLRLPPLHVLLENARERSPQVNMFAMNKEVEERELRTLRRSWQKMFKLNATFSYGTNDVNSELFYEGQKPIIQSVSGTTQRWWNVGAAVSLPLDEIFNRRNRNRQQKKRIESIRYEMDSWYDEVCMKIIESYSDAVENLAVLEPAARAMVAAQAQYAAAESDFVNGKIDAQTLSRQKSIESDAIRQYERTRALLNKSLLQLEVLSKTPILSGAAPAAADKP